MDLAARSVRKILKNSKVSSLHHANTVLTSSYFLEKGFLASRGTVERNGGLQTEQPSDQIDKAFSVWHDVFTDSVDIHERAKRPNFYGPVLFVFNLSVVNIKNGRVWVSKLNPTKWKAKTRKEKWFISTKDLKANFKFGEFDQMIIFRHAGGAIPLKKYLKYIVLDDPKRQINNTDLYSMAYGALKLSMQKGGIDVPIKRRSCISSCNCCTTYHSASETKLKKLYLPYL